METVSYTSAREKFKDIMDKVCESKAPLMITRQGAEPVVMLSLSEWEAWEETMRLMASPKNAERLNQSIKDIEEGKTISYTLPKL